MGNAKGLLSLLLSFAYFMTMPQSVASFVSTPASCTNGKNRRQNGNARSKHQNTMPHPRQAQVSSPSTTTTTTQQYARLPRLIVLDLDNTVWTPELYTLRRTFSPPKWTPVAGRDVQLLPGAAQLFQAIRQGHFSSSANTTPTQFAVASRTQSVDWAHDLLDQFDLRPYLSYIEIFPGSKIQHFTKLAQKSGLPFSEMLFLDDARSGKYGNCEPVAELGVLAVHTPEGLTSYDIVETALQRFQEWDRQPGTIVEWDGTVTNVNNAVGGERTQGVVKMVNVEKRYGFLQTEGKRDVFFHFSSLPDGIASVQQGDQLSFVCERDPKNDGKSRATEIQRIDSASSSANKVNHGKNTMRLPCFSMNMPFAALLANGYKTLETRNGTMFVPYPEGTLMLLHVGRRTYPDGDKHLEIMRKSANDSLLAATDSEIAKLKSLPEGYGKGMVVAIVELGKTYEMTVQERCHPAVQRQVVAYGQDSGKMVTEIRRVAYLKKPISALGQGGVFSLSIDSAMLPDGWDAVSDNKYRIVEPQHRATPNASTKIGGRRGDDDPSLDSKQPMYSITG